MSRLLKELSVERLRFSCPGCGFVWTADYDVQHAEDGHGLTWEYYSLNGIPVPSPSVRGSVTCPHCGATWVHWELLAVRDIPLVDPAASEAHSARPRQQVDAERQAARNQAPLLRAEQTTISDPPAEKPTPTGGDTRR